MATIPPLISDQEMLANIQQAILDSLGTGDSYTIVGSRTVKNIPMSQLLVMETKYKNRILRANGQSSVNLPDFSRRGISNVADDRRKNPS